MALFTVIVLLILLGIGDQVAKAITENDMAGQFAANGLPVKPSVTIDEGLSSPFLTQLIGKDFKKVVISASNIPAGPVTISTLNATVTGMHISGFSNAATARIDKITATALVSFGALSAALGPGGITLTSDGPDKLKVSLLGGTVTEEALIAHSGQTVNITFAQQSGDLLGSTLNAIGPLSFTLPKGVPPTLQIQSVATTPQGLQIVATATNATFSQTK